MSSIRTTKTHGKQISSRSTGIVAERIAERTPFRTFGSFYGDAPEHGVSPWDYGWLRGDGRKAWERDARTVDYVAVSFSTPVAWHTPENGWVVVDRNFSMTSSRHQAAARSGAVTDASDSRVQRVMIDYRLSDAQRDLLRRAFNPADTPTPVTGNLTRSAARLETLGLASYDKDNREISISEAGKLVFA